MKRKTVLASSVKKLESSSKEDLIDIIKEMANLISEIDATCNRHALIGEFTVISSCGCCGEMKYSGFKYSPHKSGCPIDNAVIFCRKGFNNDEV